MKKSNRVFLAIIALIMSFSALANDRPTAVLQTSSTTTAFYGDSAFYEAAAVAGKGDLITLSSGEFVCPLPISKAMRIQGSGENTRIDCGGRSLKFELGADQSGLHVEGLNLGSGAYSEIYLTDNAIDATIKSCIGEIYLNGPILNCEIAQCNIGRLAVKGEGSGLYIHNCIIGSDMVGCEAVVDRCVIGSFSNNYYGYSAKRHSIKNSFYRATSANGNPSSTSELKFMNVVASDVLTIPDGVYQENVTRLPKAEFNALFTNVTTFELTEAAAATYQADGSQIGAYGGSTPFTLIPAIPAITSVSVPSTVSHDGTLKVTFKVETRN